MRWAGGQCVIHSLALAADNRPSVGRVDGDGSGSSGGSDDGDGDGDDDAASSPTRTRKHYGACLCAAHAASCANDSPFFGWAY